MHFFAQTSTFWFCFPNLNHLSGLPLNLRSSRISMVLSAAEEEIKHSAAISVVLMNMVGEFILNEFMKQVRNYLKISEN